MTLCDSSIIYLYLKKAHIKRESSKKCLKISAGTLIFKGTVILSIVIMHRAGAQQVEVANITTGRIKVFKHTVLCGDKLHLLGVSSAHAKGKPVIYTSITP